MWGRQGKFEHEMATAAPVLHELRYGAMRLVESPKRKWLEMLIENFEDLKIENWHRQE